MPRKAQIERRTTETDIKMSFGFDGKGEYTIDTGIGFLNHMLELFARHGSFDLAVIAAGDLHVDAHHTVEDTGIVLGKLIKEALGSKVSVKRYGTAFVPMDEALAMVSLDLSGRPYLVFDDGDSLCGWSRKGQEVRLNTEADKAGGNTETVFRPEEPESLSAGTAEGFDFCLVEEFLRAVAFNAGITMHVRILCGKNRHHISEAVFKAFARALSEAAAADPRISGVLSTKGML